MNRRPSILKNWVAVLALTVAVYLVVSCVVFQFRHPWMTEMERFLHIPEACCWETVDYKETRER